MKKILIGLVTNRMVQPQTVLSIVNMVKGSKHELDFIVANQGYTISENRNYLAVQAIKGKYDYLLMVDDDMIFPEDTLDSMLEGEKEIVGVVAHSRTLPPMPVVEFLNQNEISTADRLLGKYDIPEQLFECKAVGGGVMLVKTEVFEKLPSPWFSTKVHESGMTEIGEDSWFCYKAAEHGYKIWCDPFPTIGHLGVYIY